MANKKSRVEPEAELKSVRRERTISEVGRTLRHLANVGFGAWVLNGLFDAIEAYAGEVTVANVVLRFLGELNWAVNLSWTLTLSVSVLWWRERKTRKDKVENLTERTQQLEKRLDDKRTSSKLTPRGETPRQGGR